MVFARQCSPGAVALFEFSQHFAQVFGREIRPAFGEEEKLGEGALPEQKIREALLAAGADQQVHVGGAATLDLGEHAAERFAREVRDFVEFAGGLKDGVAGGIINGQPQMELFAVGGERLGIGDVFTQRRGQAVASPDNAQPNAFIEAVGGFGDKIFLKNLQDGRDLGGRALPVCGREGEEGEGVNPQVRRAADDAAGGFGSSAVAGRAWQGAGSGPAAIAVADDGDVELGGRRRERRMVLPELLLQDFLLRLMGERVQHEHASFSAADYRNVLCIAK